MSKLSIILLLITLFLSTNVFAKNVDEGLTLDDCKRIINEVSNEYDVYLGLQTEEDEATFFEYYKDYTEEELREELERTAVEVKELPSKIYINAPDEVREKIQSQRSYDSNNIQFIEAEVQEEYIEKNTPNELKISGYYTDIIQRYTTYVNPIQRQGCRKVCGQVPQE
ncbi:MAG: hypothetical protein LBU94_00855 [Clostridiales bacterium]|jgi:hypothetical protein|nr:hypothetical protein [Clostridiales bacterium]